VAAPLATVVGTGRRTGAVWAALCNGTAAHALEAVTKYRRFRHGEAVGYGMLVAAELATARGAEISGKDAGRDLGERGFGSLQRH
jgi:3-dehydroquinate synthetase